MVESLRIGDFLRVNETPVIIHQGDIEDLCLSVSRELPLISPGTRRRVSALVEGYSIEEGLNRAAFETLITALAGKRGQGFLVNGVFGTGKSHLLAVLQLLSTYDFCWDLFLNAHPDYAPLRPQGPPTRRLLPVAFSLDAYSGKDHDLETVLWKETARHLDCLSETLTDRMHSRADRFALFQDALQGAGFEGALWLVDELSCFLASKHHADLQNDASFLQFLGQRCQSGPFFLVGALQKNVEDIGHFEPYILEQVKDRFNTRLTLQIAHAPTLIRSRLNELVNPEALESQLGESVNRWRNALPGFPEGAQDCVAAYPFLPDTLHILEAVVGRFFSRTRSALMYAQQMLTCGKTLEQPFDHLITPETVFDFFLPDIAAHPELRRYVEDVYGFYERQVAQLCPDAPGHALRLIKLLILLKIGNIQCTVKQSTHALLMDFDLPGEANYGYAQHLLERFRTEGNFVAVQRRQATFEDVYSLDLGIRVNDAVRRRVDSVLETLGPEDRRMEQFALRCCVAEEFPLARLIRPASFTVWWQNTQRKVLAQGTDLLALDKATLTHWTSSLSDPASEEDGAIFVASLFRIDQQREQWLEAARGVEDTRRRFSVACLLPREPTAEEMERLREYTACHLLSEDPSLKDNRRGRAILTRLREDMPGQTYETQRLLRSLYLQGEVFIGSQIHCRTEEMVNADQPWLFLLDALAVHMFNAVFPLFPPIAPRQRLISSTGSNSLTSEILRHGLPGNLLTPAVDRIVKALAKPLGLVKETKKGVTFGVVPKELASLCETAVGQGRSYMEAERSLGKSEYGLPPELTQLVMAAMLRQGRLTAFKSDRESMPVESLRPPLRDAIASLNRGQLISEEDWRLLAVRLPESTGLTVPQQRTFEHQEQVWSHLCRWRESLTVQHATGRQSLNCLLQEVGQPATQWTATGTILSTVGTWLERIDPSRPASDGLKAWLETPAHEFPDSEELRDFEQRSRFLNDNRGDIAGMYRYLQEVTIASHDSLPGRRSQLLSTLSRGEEMMSGWPSLQQEWRRFLSDYITAYMHWHSLQNASTRVASYLGLRQAPDYQRFHLLGKIVVFAQESGEDWVTACLSRFCDYPGLATALTESPRCPQCRLEIGREMRIPSVDELLVQYRQAVESRFARLRQPEILERLHRHTQSDPAHPTSLLITACNFLRSGDTESFLNQLNDETVRHLNLALSPRKRVARQTAHLTTTFSGQLLTKGNALRTFESWLDGEDGLRPEDEVHFE